VCLYKHRFGLAMAVAKGATRLAPPVLLLDEYLDHEDGRYYFNKLKL
jgi:hypothetical protein